MPRTAPQLALITAPFLLATSLVATPALAATAHLPGYAGLHRADGSALRNHRQVSWDIPQTRKGVFAEFQDAQPL